MSHGSPDLRSDQAISRYPYRSDVSIFAQQWVCYDQADELFSPHKCPRQKLLAFWAANHRLVAAEFASFVRKKLRSR